MARQFRCNKAGSLIDGQAAEGGQEGRTRDFWGRRDGRHLGDGEETCLLWRTCGVKSNRWDKS